MHDSRTFSSNESIQIICFHCNQCIPENFRIYLPQKNAALMNENCCICLDAQEYTEKVIFNCTHSCCVNCTAGLLTKTFQNGIQTQAVCPMCRASIKTVVLPYTVSRVKNTPKNNKANVMNSKQANLLKPFCK